MTTAPHPNPQAIDTGSAPSAEPARAASDGGPLDAAAFRRAGHALIDWIADYR